MIVVIFARLVFHTLPVTIHMALKQLLRRLIRLIFQRTLHTLCTQQQVPVLCLQLQPPCLQLQPRCLQLQPPLCILLCTQQQVPVCTQQQPQVIQ